VQKVDADSFPPHSGQNFPPSIFALQFGQVTLARVVRSRSAVQSVCRTFSWICSTCAAACAREISSATLGEQTRHCPMSWFQHTGTHTQLPQPRHCLNWSLTASTASAIARSLLLELVPRS